MEHVFTKELNAELLEKATLFVFNNNAVIEQYPGWYNVNGVSNFNYYLGITNGNLVTFSTIIETKNKKAVIEFGPVFIEPDDAIESINEITKYYKKKKYNTVKIQLFIPTGSDSEYIDQMLFLNSKIKHYVNKNENWSSMEIDLTLSEEEIFSNFSKGHKSAIKKAIKAGVKVSEVEDSDMIQFLNLFIKMHKVRSLPINENQTIESYSKMYAFLKQRNIGSILGVFNDKGIMIGGIFIIRQGNRVRYFKGAADPDIKDIPVLHCALFEGLKLSKKWGAEIFDFWGICLLADKCDQRYNINIFKRGFGGKLKVYPKTIYIPLNYAMFLFYQELFPVIKKLIKSIRIFLDKK